MNGLNNHNNDNRAGLSARWRNSSLAAIKPSPPSTRALYVQEAPIFFGLSLAACGEVAALAQENIFRRGEPIFRSGGPVRAVMVAATGRVKLTHLNTKGKEVILRVDGDGDILDILTTPGTGSLRLHRYSALALETTRVLWWTPRLFEDLESKFPVICTNGLEILAERLLLAEVSFLDLATLPVAPRLARLLLRLLDGRKVKRAGDARIELTNDQLASMIGTTVFSVSRLLASWEKQGILHTHRKVVEVENLIALQGEAETLHEHGE